MIKKFAANASATRIKVSTKNNRTQTSDQVFNNKPFVLKEIQSRSDTETYRALRAIFQNNRTTTYSLSILQGLDMLDDMIEDFLPSPTKPTMKKDPEKKLYQTTPKRSRIHRKKIRSTKMWKPV